MLALLLLAIFAGPPALVMAGFVRLVRRLAQPAGRARQKAYTLAASASAAGGVLAGLLWKLTLVDDILDGKEPPGSFLRCWLEISAVALIGFVAALAVLTAAYSINRWHLKRRATPTG